MEVVRTFHSSNLYRAAEDTNVEIGARRHFDVQICTDDIVARSEPAVVALIRVDDDGGAFDVDVELHAVQALARRRPDGVDDDLRLIVGGDRHPSREDSEPERSAGIELD